MTNEFNIFDLTVSNNQRYIYLLKEDEMHQFEILKRFMDIYRITKIKKLEKFFIYICTFDNHINLYLKQELLQSLTFEVKNKGSIEQGYNNVIFLILKKALTNLEYWFMLENTILNYNKEFKGLNIYILLKNIIIIFFGGKKASFKQLFNLLLNFKHEYYFILLCTFFFEKYKQNLTVKNNLLLLQIIFEKNNDYKEDLFHIINNKNFDINLQLEACDILLNKGDENVKSKVQKIIQNILPITAYTNNPENAHLSSLIYSVDKSIESILNLNKGKKLPSNLQPILLQRYKKSINFLQINGALNRIFNYNFLTFTKYKLTLKKILENIWLVVESSEFKEELYNRLEQELVDMYNTCSQGYLTRLINIFSGFDNGLKDVGITISYEDEIYTLFSNQINKIVDNAPEIVKNQLLEELMVPTNDYQNRLNLIRFLRPHLPKIWNEIFEMYKDILSITDLDLYCRKVTMKYEGC
ncbi:hypothetical protein IIV22A_152L [Invertebrate iridescent virus 22]|uniref:Uncharacterized protein n=1 Tax=Invertebrate iridescent virus 22 TaxID=345198 RepID=W8W206_9VIRU|nr:hypothetical protein IIV22A_152L [Invertebrate iridescent virus 22]CCV01996.1 hypothetical protein IIV22A_152L [Invertebrate iridescent virus 22]